ncbi:MAG TPA: CoA-binding protein, partial [Candidatus Methylomirabilis sp.]|nr:CoA-binding protein [Candidatus Methylomirabilis sp.]
MEDTTKKSLAPFFEPRSVAIIGASATPGKAGYEAIRNVLANGYPGKIHPVNPKGGEI